MLSELNVPATHRVDEVTIIPSKQCNADSLSPAPHATDNELPAVDDTQHHHTPSHEETTKMRRRLAGGAGRGAAGVAGGRGV